MVSVTHKFTPSSVQAGPNIQAWIDSLSKSFTPEELAKIRHACEFVEPLYAEQMELTGIPLLQHALGTAAILAGMNMDYETLVAAILHAVPEHLPNWMEQVASGFNANIVMLVLGISRMEEIQDFSETSGLHKAEKNKGDQAQQIESLRKMLLAMVEDIRVVLIKLAE
ncbi:MAG: HD domain-containing protein, partial [Gallionellaceae bacterium]